MNKAIYYFVGMVLGLVVLVINQMPASRAKMVVCDVGQGDAILIIKGSTQTLIDGGPSGAKILSCLEKHLPFWDREIELIVLTNTDSDHMNGLSAVMHRYSVLQFATSDGVHESTALSQFIQVLNERHVPMEMVGRGDKVRIGGVQHESSLEFRVLWPPDPIMAYGAVFSSQINDTQREQLLQASAKRGNLNERSVVLHLLEDNKSILLTGDAGFQTEQSLLEYGNLPHIDLLKVGHHGSKYASSLEFLEKIRPTEAIISVGAKNRYGHPTAETLDRLKSVGTIIRRTDIEGDIELDL